MKNIYKIFFIFFVFTFEAKSKMLVLEDLRNPGNTIGGQEWYFVTDGVMGGVSEGSAKLDKVEKTKCHRMTGNVSTENNGGFIQLRSTLSFINFDKHLIKLKGVKLRARGNGEVYHIFILPNPGQKIVWLMKIVFCQIII